MEDIDWKSIDKIDSQIIDLSRDIDDADFRLRVLLKKRMDLNIERAYLMQKRKDYASDAV